MLYSHATSSVFNPVSEASISTLPLNVQHLCDLWDAIPHHWLPDAYQPPYLLSGLTCGQQFNFKVSRASYSGSKHSSGQTVCLNHNEFTILCSVVSFTQTCHELLVVKSLAVKK